MSDNQAASEHLTPTENNDIRHVAAGNLAFLLSVIRCGETLSGVEEANVRSVIDKLEAAAQPPIAGVDLIAQERQRQIEHYTPEHDDEHDLGELGLAAALYALPYDSKVGDEHLLKQEDFINLDIALSVGCNFQIKPDPNPLRRLAKAGALIIAELDRRLRLEHGGNKANASE